MKDFSKKVLAFVALFVSVQNGSKLYAFNVAQQQNLTVTNNSASSIIVGMYKQEYKRNVNYVKAPDFKNR